MNLYKILISNFKKNLSNKHFSEILSGSLLSFGMKIFTVIIGLLTNLIIVKFYGSDVLGTLSLLISVITIATMLSLLGIDVSILRFIPPLILKKSNSEIYNIFFKSTVIIFVLSVIITIMIYFSSDLIADTGLHKPHISPLISLISFFIVFNVISKFSFAGIRAFKNIKLFVALQSLTPILNIILLLISTFFLFNKYNPIYTYIVTLVLVAIISFWFLNKYLNNYKTGINQSNISYKEILIVSFPMFLTTVIQMIVLQTDVLMLGNMNTLVNVGIYSIVMKLALLSSFIINSVNTIIAPKFSELYYNNNIIELKNVATKSSKLIFYLTLPITFILILFGNYLLSIFGAEFKLGYLALVFLASGQLINAMAGSVGYFLNMTGHQKKLNYILLIGGISNVILNIFLIPIYGITGAAFASMVSMILWNLIASRYVKKQFGFFIGFLPLITRIIK